MDQQEKPVVSIHDVDRYFEQQVSTYQHELYTYALHLTHHSQDAEDIFQEAIVRAYVAMKSYSLQEIQVLRPRPWLYKIMTNVFLNTQRVQKPVLTPFFISEESQEMNIEDDWRERPDVVVETAEQLQQLNNLVERLPGRFRAAILLYFFQGFSYAEIAETLGQPLNTVKANLSHGKQLLRQAILAQKAMEGK